MQHNKGAFAFASAAQYTNRLESLILRKLSILQVEKTASIKKNKQPNKKNGCERSINPDHSGCGCFCGVKGFDFPVLQNVTAIRWVLSTTGATAQASASAERAPRGPSVTTACQDTTGSKAAIVSLTMGLLSRRPLCLCVSRCFFPPVGIDHVAH